MRLEQQGRPFFKFTKREKSEKQDERFVRGEEKKRRREEDEDREGEVRGAQRERPESPTTQGELALGDKDRVIFFRQRQLESSMTKGPNFPRVMFYPWFTAKFPRWGFKPILFVESLTWRWQCFFFAMIENF